MKIGIIVYTFLPKWLAGTEIATFNIAKELVKRGHEVHIITSLDSGMEKESQDQGFHVHRIRRRQWHLIGTAIFNIKILYMLMIIRPDIAHSQGIHLGIPCILYKKISKRKYVVWGRGSDVYLKWPLKEQIFAPILKNASSVIALTKDMKEQMQNIYSRDVYVIPNGIDQNAISFSPSKEIRRDLNINDKENVLIFVGTLRSIKGIDYLIRAMNLIKQSNKNTKLLIIGDGPDRDYLISMTNNLELENEVIFVGKVSNERVIDYMSISDIFVLPSISEGFGIVNLEAMASGLPIIATNVGGLSEIIRDGKNGFIVEPKNPDQIAEKVLILLENDELRELISKNNKEESKKYTWEHVVDSLEEVYFHHL